MKISQFMSKKIQRELRKDHILFNLSMEVKSGNTSARRIYNRLKTIEILIFNIKKPLQKNYARKPWTIADRKRTSDFIDREYLKALHLEEKQLINLAVRHGQPKTYLNSLRGKQAKGSPEPGSMKEK